MMMYYEIPSFILCLFAVTVSSCSVDIVEPIIKEGHTVIAKGSSVTLKCVQSGMKCLSTKIEASDGTYSIKEGCEVIYTKKEVHKMESYECLVTTQSETIKCYLPLHLRVAYPPSELTGNISCISANWLSLECRWGNAAKLKFNVNADIKNTTWKVSYSRIGYKVQQCPDLNEILQTCLWVGLNYDRYEQYKITVYGSNLLGDTSKTISVNPIDVVKANVVSDVKSVARTNLTLTISWIYPGCDNIVHSPRYKALRTFHILLKFRIEIYDSRNLFVKKIIMMKSASCNRYSYTIDSLVPFSMYHITIFTSKNGSNIWSAGSKQLIAKTDEGVPIRYPRTSDSSYHQEVCGHDCRNLKIYYQRLSQQEACGEVIKVSACYWTIPPTHPLACVPCEIQESYCYLENLSKEKAFRVFITAATSAGFTPIKADSISDFRCPENQYGALPPYNVVAERKTKTTVTVYWEPPLSTNPLKFFVHYRCKGMLYWNKSERNQYTIYNVDPDTCEYAVACQDKHKLSAGLSTWVKCAYTAGKGPQVVPLIHQHLPQDKNNFLILKLTWEKLTCSAKYGRPEKLLIFWRSVPGGLTMNATLAINSSGYGIPVQNSTCYNVSLVVVASKQKRYDWHVVGRCKESIILELNGSPLIPVVVALTVVTVAFILIVLICWFIRKWKSTPMIEVKVPKLDDEFETLYFENLPKSNCPPSTQSFSIHPDIDIFNIKRENLVSKECKPLLANNSLTTSGVTSGDTSFSFGLSDQTRCTNGDVSVNKNNSSNCNNSNASTESENNFHVSLAQGSPANSINAIPVSIDCERIELQPIYNIPKESEIDFTVPDTDCFNEQADVNQTDRPVSRITSDSSSMTTVSSDSHHDLQQDVMDGYHRRIIRNDDSSLSD